MESSLGHLDKLIEAKRTALEKLREQSGSSSSIRRQQEVDVLRSEIRQLEGEKDQIALELMLQSGDEQSRRTEPLSANDVFSRSSIARALRDIHSPSSLGKHRMAKLQIVNSTLATRALEDTAYSRGLILIDLFGQAIDSLKPEGAIENGSTELRYYHSLQLRYLDGLGRQETAKAMNVSLLHYDRLHTNALEALSDILRGYELGARSKSDDSEDLKAVLENLRRRPWLFVGRENEQEYILEALSPEHRQWLAILLGPGGIGKTTLALEIAHVCKDKELFEVIVWADAGMESLRGIYREHRKPSVGTLDHLFLLIGQAAGVNLSRQSEEERHRAVVEILRTRRCLLIVDNFETLEGQSDFCHFLEAEIPEPSKVIVTTRHDVIEGGRRVNLKGLGKEDTRILIRSEANEKDIATLRAASNETLDLIWEATDGSPLALEWFLGQVMILSLDPEQLADEMLTAHTGRDEELLEFCFGRSYAALSEPARRLLSLFPYFNPTIGVAVPTLRSIADTTISQLNPALSLLRRLSLVYDVKPGRYSTLDLTNKFLGSRITQSDQDANLIKVVDYWRKYLNAYEKDYPRVDREYQNILFIADVCFQEEKPRGGITLVLTIGNFLLKNGPWSDLIGFYSRALDEANKLQDDELEARLSVELAWYFTHIGEWEECATLTERGILLAQKAHDLRTEALALRNLAALKRHSNQLIAAKSLFEKALDLLSQLGDRDLRSIVLMPYVTTLERLEEYVCAEELLTEEIEYVRKIDSERVSIATYYLGSVAMARGDYLRAEALLHQCLHLDNKLGRPLGEAYAKEKLAMLMEQMNRGPEARAYAEEAVTMLRSLGANKRLETAEELLRRLSVNSIN